MRLLARAAALGLTLAACGAGIPKAEIDRCNLGVADGNDGYTVRQGTACGLLAQRLAADERPGEAMGYARKSCDLEDAHGCLEYLALARSQPSLPPDELLRARTAGERACDGMVVGADGADARPAICARTAELYGDVAPRSRDDAARLFARACKLGDDRSCGRATALGATLVEHPTEVAPKAATDRASAASPAPALARTPAPPLTTAPATPSSSPGLPSATTAAAPCHEMRPCVALDVQQRNTSEVVGTITNHCAGNVTCAWCPARSDQVDKASCHSATLAPGESRAGREGGLWYDGYNAIAYDCMDASDARGCLAM